MRQSGMVTCRAIKFEYCIIYSNVLILMIGFLMWRSWEITDKMYSLFISTQFVNVYAYLCCLIFVEQNLHGITCLKQTCGLRIFWSQIHAFVACKTNLWQFFKTVVKKNCTMDLFDNYVYLSGRAMPSCNSEHVHTQCSISYVPQNAQTVRVNGEFGPKLLKQKYFLNKKW